MVDLDKLVVLVPARLGSNRVKVKNLRLLGDRPLIEHCINTLKQSKFLNKNIVINSDSDLFKIVAENQDIGFYKRDPKLATSASLIDDYIYDFISSSDCEYLAVVNPTSPFMSANSYDKAWELFRGSDCDTLLSCEKIQTHCFLGYEPLNFSTKGQHPRSQDLQPVRALNFAISIWNCEKYKSTYEAEGYGVYSGKIEFFETSGFENIDIDYPDDFQMAEVVQAYLEKNEYENARYPKYVEEYLAKNPKVSN